MSEKVFVDSDVVISSLLSTKGAAYLILNQQDRKFIISNISQKELEKVAQRLKINQGSLKNLIKKQFDVIKLTQELTEIKEEFANYTSDINDSHIVAGAKKAKAKFLLTYNLRHYNRLKIKADLGIIVLTPAQYLQYLRSLE